MPENKQLTSKAEQQFLGFFYAKKGVRLAELVESMGLTVQEWEQMQKEYKLEYLSQEDKTEITQLVAYQST